VTATVRARQLKITLESEHGYIASYLLESGSDCVLVLYNNYGETTELKLPIEELRNIIQVYDAEIKVEK
jgi:hypothetical protein